jgi:4-carboxymuconolactone decarboxylase
MSRIPYLTVEELSEEQRRLAQKLAASRGGRLLGPGAFWLRNPALAEQADELRLLMERHTSLPRRLSELAILVANRHFSATYAWCRHALAATRAGLDQSVIDALGDRQEPIFSDTMEETVYRVSREILETTGLSATTFARGLDVLGPERLIELVAIVGYACMLSLAINTFEPDLLPDDDGSLAPAGPPPTTYARTTGGLRVPPLQEAVLSERQQRIASQLEVESPGRVRGVYAIWLRRPEIADRAFQYEQVLHGTLSIPKSLLELAVLVTARFWTADELWAAHRGLAADTGIEAAVIAAIADNRVPRCSGEDEAVVHAFANELLTQGRVTDNTLAQSVRRFGYQRVIELVAVVGFYSMVALTLNAFESTPARDQKTLPRVATS